MECGQAGAGEEVGGRGAAASGAVHLRDEYLDVHRCPQPDRQI